ncbi:MAG: hypothetical protein AAFU67_07460 [Bacteroidota bacterium]
MKSNNTAILLVGGALLLFFMNNQSTPRYIPQQTYIPPAPPPNQASAWADWARTIISIYGDVAALYQPGGPFYRLSDEEAIALRNLGAGLAFGI